MDENAKEYLYEQLEQIVQYSVKEDKEELISKEEFMEMTGVDCLKYVFEYRDNNEPYEFNGEKGEAYIQIPNIDLSNEDLNDVILRGFILSHTENDDEVISSINFANTGITLDLNSILENQTEQTGATTKRIIDFSQCNFEGCTIYGILPDEYQSETAKITDGYEVRGREKLGEEYAERRKKLHDVQAPKTLSRRSYERLTDGRDFSRLNGITYATGIHLEDFDFDANDEQELGEMYQILYEELEARKNLDGIYTNMNLSSEFIKSTFQKLNGGYAKGKFLQELVREGKELDFVKSKFDELASDDKRKVLEELVRQGQGFEFVYKNARYIQDEETKKKIKEQAQQSGISAKEIYLKFNPNLANLLELIDEDIDFIKEKFKELNSDDKVEVLKELIRQGKELDFVKEKFEDLGNGTKVQILQELVRQGKELDFVKSKLGYIDGKGKILQELIRQGKELDFVKEEFESLLDDNKGAVLRELVREGKELDFVKNKFDELTYKDLYYDIIIKLDFEQRKRLENKCKSEILQELVRQGKELDFVKEKFKSLQDKYKSKVLKELIKQEKELNFVKEKFEELDCTYKGGVLKGLVRQGKELDFVKSKFDELYSGDKSKVLKELIRQNQMFELILKNARYIQGEKTKKQIKEQALQKGISEKKIEFQFNPDVDKLLEFIDEDIDFIKENFEVLVNKDKSQFLQELIRRGKEIDFVKEEIEGLRDDDKGEILQELIRQGKEIDFVKKKFEELDYYRKVDVLQELIRQGQEIDFVKKKFEEFDLDDSYRKKVVLQELIRQGQEIGFVKKKFEELASGHKEEVLKELVRQEKELNFVKEKFEKLDSGCQEGVLQELIRQGKELNFVKGSFEELRSCDKGGVLEELARQGKELDFVKKKFEEVAFYGKEGVLEELVRQGKELDFVKSKFDELEYAEYKSQVLEELVRQGKEFEFAFENARYIQDEEIKEKVKEQALQNGISEKKIEWQLNPNGDNLLEFIDEDIDFVKENFESLEKKDKSRVLQELVKQGKFQDFVDENWKYIKGNEPIQIDSNQFRNIVGCGEKETQELIKLIERSQISLTDLIRKKAILASCGIDIKDALKNRTLMQTSPAVLYAKKRYYESVGKPTNISNLGMPRAKFENMSGKTLTGICNEYVFSDRYDNLKDTVVEEINKEIQGQKEKKAEQTEKMQNQQQSRIEAKSNPKAHKVNPVVSTFLQTQVGITEKQEQKLGEWLQRFNYDIYSQNVEEDLVLKKQIFDQFGVTSQAFGMSCKILTIPLKTLYARAQFLKDIGEKVTPANLMATLGANGDIFAQKYGSYFMEEKTEQDAQYIMNVENATNENYPMPKTKEEIMRKIKEMEEEQK